MNYISAGEKHSKKAEHEDSYDKNRRASVYPVWKIFHHENWSETPHHHSCVTTAVGNSHRKQHYAFTRECIPEKNLTSVKHVEETSEICQHSSDIVEHTPVKSHTIVKYVGELSRSLVICIDT